MKLTVPTVMKHLSFWTLRTIWINWELNCVKIRTDASFLMKNVWTLFWKFSFFDDNFMVNSTNIDVRVFKFQMVLSSNNLITTFLAFRLRFQYFKVWKKSFVVLVISDNGTFIYRVVDPSALVVRYQYRSIQCQGRTMRCWFRHRSGFRLDHLMIGCIGVYLIRSFSNG